jgi:hypothetical protein
MSRFLVRSAGVDRLISACRSFQRLRFSVAALGFTMLDAGAKYGIMKTSWSERVRLPLKFHLSYSTGLNEQAVPALRRPFARVCN